MARWALLFDTYVTTVVDSASQPADVPGGAWVNVDGKTCGPGYTTPDGGVTFVAPVVSVTSITGRAFWKRWPVAAREALQNLVATGTQAQKNKLNAFREYVVADPHVDLTDQYIIDSVTMARNAGIITQAEADAILATN